MSATILVSSSLLQIRRPISNFSSAQVSSIAVQLHHYYNNLFPGPQSVSVKKENGIVPNSPSEKLRHTETKLYFLLAGWTWRPEQCRAAGISVPDARRALCPAPRGHRGSDPSWGWISATPMAVTCGDP